MIMRNLFLTLSIFTLLISCSSDDSSDAVPTNNNVVQETFGNWSPDFTNQTANFTQARTGTQGTQQTRTIVITVTSSTATSTEEILEEDINGDEDLFDDVEITTSNYSASEGLGSHTMVSYSITNDNDMVLKIGNQSYPLIVGTIKNYGAYEMEGDGYPDLDCQGKGLFNFDIELYTEGIELNNDGDPNGEGRSVYFELWSENKSNLKSSNYLDILNSVNQYYDLNFSSLEDFGEWYDNNYPDGDSKFETDDCFVYDLLNLTSTNSIIERFESDNNFSETELNFPDGILKYNLNPDGSHKIELTGGTDSNGLPVSFYFKGFLSSFDYSDDASKSTGAKMKNKKLFKN